MDFVIVDKNSVWLEAVNRLGDSARNTIGFLPHQAFLDYAAKDRILAAVDSECLLGYVLYSVRGSLFIIIQLCVDSKYRNQGIAKKILDELMERNKYNIAGMQLACRRDYKIDDFWRAAGFMPIGERKGRAITEETTLTQWYRPNPDNPDLFSVYACDKTTKKVVVDTNIVIDLCENSDAESQALFQPFITNDFAFYITRDSLSEINKNDNPTVRVKHIGFAKSAFEIINIYDENLYSNVLEDLLSRKGKSIGTNTGYDISHIAYAIAFDAEVFITRDSEWLNTAFSDYIFEKYGLLIKSPSEFIKAVDEICLPDMYEPQKLAGLELKYSEMQHESFTAVVDALYDQFGDKKKSTFQKKLRVWMSDTYSTHLQLVKSKDEIVSLVVYRIDGTQESISNIFVNYRAIKPSLLNTFVKRLAVKLLEDAKNKNISLIAIDKTGIDTLLVQPLKECLYCDSGDSMFRFIFRKVLNKEQLAFEVGKIEEQGIKGLIDIYLQPEVPLEVRMRAAMKIEKSLWPLKIMDDEIPCYIVPIQPHYAKELFDEELSNMNYCLFSNDKMKPALSVENVYYKKKPRHINKFPARILWYVSNSGFEFGTKMIRACSYLDCVEIDTTSNLYKKYKRLGVLNWDDMLRIGNPDQEIVAYRFSYTELLKSPVTLKNIQNILNANVTFQSYRKITPSEFFTIYKKGNNYE